MKRSLRQPVISVLVIIIGFAAVYILSNFLERNRISVPENYADSDLAFQGKRLKGYVLGSEGLLADWYWILSLQYIGGKLEKSDTGLSSIDSLQSLNPRLLYPYLENATDLDPKFMAAYSYGAVVLPAIDPKQAIALTEKGIANNPEQWRLYQYLGYIYWRSKDYDKASEIYEKGSQIKDANSFMKMMAAAMKTQAGSRETARAMYRQMLAEATDAQTRVTGEARLQELDWFDERDAIRSALNKFKESSGRCAQSTRELLPLLRNAKLPEGREFVIDNSNNLIDPSGALYLLDQKSCDVTLDVGRTKVPLS